MVTVRKNSSFKVKMGRVENTAGLAPEAGALLYDASIKTVIVGDGFNWLPVGGAITLDEALALLAATFTESFISGNPEDINFFDTIVYNVGTGFTPSIPGGSVTFNLGMNVAISVTWQVRSSANNTILTVRPKINGAPVQETPNFLDVKNKPYQIFSLTNIVVNPADVLTLEMEADKTCIITYDSIEIGMQNQNL